MINNRTGSIYRTQRIQIIVGVRFIEPQNKFEYKKNIYKPRKNYLRLKNFDYSQESLYFITICVHEHKLFFGEIEHDKIILNKAGNEVRNILLNLENYFDRLAIDEYIVMPNHIHSIIFITNDIENINYIRQNRIETENYRNMVFQNNDLINRNRGSINRTPTHTIPLKKNITALGDIIRYFKGKSCYNLRKIGYINFKWQRNFYVHIIRNNNDYQNIKEYILNNPLKWTIDKYYKK